MIMILRMQEGDRESVHLEMKSEMKKIQAEFSTGRDRIWAVLLVLLGTHFNIVDSWFSG